MKARMPNWARVVSVLLALLCGLLAIGLIGSISAATSYPYQPAVVRVTGARAEQTEQGCRVTLELENCSSTAAELEPDDFYLYDEGYSWLAQIGGMQPDYTNPFSSGWTVALPAGRSGEISFLTVPPEGDQITLYWYEGEEEHQLVFPVE